MLIIIISRSNLKLDHVGSKTRLLGHQATQVSDLGPLWPSCFQKLAYKYAKSVFIHSVVLKCERIDFIVFTFSVGLFLHFL